MLWQYTIQYTIYYIVYKTSWNTRSFIYEYEPLTNYAGKNVALKKVATQHPGQWETSSAEKAVDGGGSKADGKCAGTDVGSVTNRAWWRVDLGQTYMIQGIRIVNRNKGGKMHCDYHE